MRIFMFSLCQLFILVIGNLVVNAYIPAVPTNDSAKISASVNLSDLSTIQLAWYPQGSYETTVSHQLVGSGSSGVNKGAFVHFSENNLTTDTTTTPWIALVACDFNTSTSSPENDIFTLARARGAVSALLYSEWSEACIINPEYANHKDFDHPIDVFSTKSLPSSRIITSEFLTINQTLFGDFNAERLNGSANVINETLATNVVPSSSYMFATLTAAANITNSTSTNTSTGSTPSRSSGSKASMKTEFVLIVLQVITGATVVVFG
ncbi:hypothetical protein BD410DRAFT_830693 [Rickenella mellea]|uniref:Uncharacterized protein n=1 Tax=Rickenella mellea TaxID=50990 RepID=A0A4Y7PUV3_9AGAM|nr:hypothetical protein BD410DRAFT_830693 [Rickenella mellea]